MLTRRSFRLLAALLVFSTIATQAQAQREIHNVPPVIDADGYKADVMHPFIEPFAFGPDFQFFAPAEADLINNEIEADLGWFGTYDRMYLYVSRPEVSRTPTQGDFGWGNRMDFGYMTDEDHGWLVSLHHMDAPNNWKILEHERIDVVQGADEINLPINAIILRGAPGGGVIPPAQPVLVLPIQDRNDPVTNQRDYRLHESINVAKLNSFELNKMFRLAPRHHGSIVEPFFGFRYMNFEDYFRRDVYSRLDGLTGALIYSTDAFGFFPPPPIAGVNVERFDSFQSVIKNHMFGGQMGMRWYKQKSRWNLSGEVRAFVMQNFQSFDSTLSTEWTAYAAGTPGSLVQIVLKHQEYGAAHADEFVFGTEIRAEAAYDLTRDIQLRVGMQFMDFARGIGRGSNLDSNDQDVLMVGTTFGFAVNR